jgi:Holliday junction resolvasome RuvABC endonuclease subunit
MRQVVGLDVSLTATGICVAHGDPRCRVDSTAGPVVETAVITAGQDYRGPERLSRVAEAVFSWVRARVTIGGTLFVQEGYAFSAQTAHSLGEIGGCVRRDIWEHGGNLLVVPPQTLKKFITGKGAGDKNVVIKHAFKRWGFDNDDDNQVDAFGCAMVGLVDELDDDAWTTDERDMLTRKVQRHAGKGQTGWPRAGAQGTVARCSLGRQRSRRVDLGSAVLGEDLQGPRRRRRDGA